MISPASTNKNLSGKGNDKADRRRVNRPFRLGQWLVDESEFGGSEKCLAKCREQFIVDLVGTAGLIR